MSKLPEAGHSFGGGITAFRTAFKDKRVKACIAFDPWLYLHEPNILNETLNLDVPFISADSEHFAKICGKYDTWRPIETLFYNSTYEHNDNIAVKNLHHAQ